MLSVSQSFNKNSKIKKIVFSSIFLISSSAYAESDYYNKNQYPNVSGQVLFELKSDRLQSNKNSGSSPNNAYINIEPDFSFNVNKNWSVKTGWRIYQTNTVETRDPIHPERTRNFFSEDRGLKLQDTTMIVEELKIDYKADDFKIFAGKFNPDFGEAHIKEKRIGIFSTDITEDYQLREKIGGGIVADIGTAKVAVSSFFNDTTGLSSSINGRKKEDKNDVLAGNTQTLSSYTVSMNGDSFFGFDNWSYNAGYRSLAVDTTIPDTSRETGYVFGSKYLLKTGYRTSISPFVEYVRINNFTGKKGRDATYTTLALIGKFGNWNISASNVTRNIDQYKTISKSNDRQTQFSVGYKFASGIILDFSRANIKESDNSGSLYGAIVSYLYKF
jgi:hypothetical protein